MNCVFITHSIVTELQDSFVSADDGGILGSEANKQQESQVIVVFNKDLVERIYSLIYV
jgi:hypothetical protein